MSLCLFCFSSYQFLFHIFCYFLRKDIKKYPLAQIIPLGARRICNPPLKNVLTFLGIADLQSATFSLCFLRCCWGITNPPVLIGRTFFYGGFQIRRDAWRGTFFWRLAGDFLPLGARRICNPPLKNVLTFLGFADLQSATSSLCISTPGGNKRKKKGKQCCFPLF